MSETVTKPTAAPLMRQGCRVVCPGYRRKGYRPSLFRIRRGPAETPAEVIADAVLALRACGMKKSDAGRKVKAACAGRAFAHVTDLIRASTSKGK